MAETLEQRFQRASQEVTQLSEAPDNLTKLRLYALFKQATQGDCTGPRPGLLDMVGRAKYDAWKALEGTTKEAAMEQYIALVEELKAADKK
jgi:acyl-CoA-binding protein